MYGDNRIQQQKAYRQDPSQFLAGLTTAIETEIMNCNGKVPVITGKTKFVVRVLRVYLTLVQASLVLCRTLSLAALVVVTRIYAQHCVQLV